MKLYGYWESDNMLTIVGQIFAIKLEEKCCLICSIYDKDGDVIHSSENDHYGAGVVTNTIYPDAFFSGFPFRFSLYGVSKKKVKEIKIVPAESY